MGADGAARCASPRLFHGEALVRGARVEDGFDAEPGTGLGGANEIDDGLVLPPRLVRHKPPRLRLIQGRQQLHAATFLRRQMLRIRSGRRDHRPRAYASPTTCTSYFSTPPYGPHLLALIKPIAR